VTALGTTARGGARPDAETLRDAIARVDLETPLGRVKFDARGEPLFYERVIVQVQAGRHVVVYPPPAARARLVHPRP
jgi:hypothetical protein